MSTVSVVVPVSELVPVDPLMLVTVLPLESLAATDLVRMAD
jgi:hypothetical protein